MNSDQSSSVNQINVGDVSPSVSAKKIAASTDLVDLARQIQSFEQFVNANACSRLHLIVDQMQHLKRQAETILRDLRNDVAIHQLPCNFIKKPNTVYHVYERPDGTQYMGLLSPEDWGSNCPHKYVNSYKLLPDMTWLPVAQLNAHAKISDVVQKLVSSNEIDYAGNKMLSYYVAACFSHYANLHLHASVNLVHICTPSVRWNDCPCWRGWINQLVQISCLSSQDERNANHRMAGLLGGRCS